MADTQHQLPPQGGPASPGGGTGCVRSVCSSREQSPPPAAVPKALVLTLTLEDHTGITDGLCRALRLDSAQREESELFRL